MCVRRPIEKRFDIGFRVDNSNAPTYLGVGVALPALASMRLGVGFILLMFSVGPGAVTVDLTVTVRDRATKQPVAGCAVAFEAGRDGFWLARWLRAHGIEVHVIHASSVAVSREHRRAKTDRLDTELLKRAFLG